MQDGLAGVGNWEVWLKIYWILLLLSRVQAPCLATGGQLLTESKIKRKSRIRKRTKSTIKIKSRMSRLGFSPYKPPW
jgi:hypothetical protein